MSIQLTITIAGQDHPQLINQLAAKTHELGGKWLVSKISRLDKQVAGIIKIEVPESRPTVFHAIPNKADRSSTSTR